MGKTRFQHVLLSESDDCCAAGSFCACLRAAYFLSLAARLRSRSADIGRGGLVGSCLPLARESPIPGPPPEDVGFFFPCGRSARFRCSARARTSPSVCTAESLGAPPSPGAGAGASPGAGVVGRPVVPSPVLDPDTKTQPVSS